MLGIASYRVEGLASFSNRAVLARFWHSSGLVPAWFADLFELRSAFGLLC